MSRKITSLMLRQEQIIRTHKPSSYFFCVIRDSNGRNRTQSCELCARPGVIAQTNYCRAECFFTIRLCVFFA